MVSVIYQALSCFKARSSSHYQLLKQRRTQRTGVVEVKAYHRDFNEVGSSGYGHILKVTCTLPAAMEVDESYTV